MNSQVQRSFLARLPLQRRRPVLSLIAVAIALLGLLAALVYFSPRQQLSSAAPAPLGVQAEAADAAILPAEAYSVTGETTPPLDATPAQADAEALAADVIAVVNTSVLDAGEWQTQSAVDQVMAEMAGASPESGASLALDRLVNGELVWQAAQTAGYSVPETEANAALGELLAQYGRSEAELDAALTAAGLTRAQFDLYMQRLLTVDRFAAAQARSAGVTPGEFVQQLQAAGQISFGPRAAAVTAGSDMATQDTSSVATLVQAVATQAPGSGSADDSAEDPAQAQDAVAAVKPVVQAPVAQEARGISPGQLAPELGAVLLGGSGDETIEWPALAGGPVVLSFWTTWCPYCRKQMPILIDAYTRLAEQGVQVVGVNVKEDKTIVAGYVDESMIPFPVGLDVDGSVADRFAVSGFPTTYFLDAEGRVVQRQVGALTPEQFEEIISRLIPPDSP